MNLLLLQDHQFISDDLARANKRQSEHIRCILKLCPGDSIQIGRVNGLIGQGTIKSLGHSVCIENITLDTVPPHPLPVTLILAMPRPQMLKRILQTAAAMGVAKLCFLQTSRVEKSFWQSPSASQEAIEQQLILGLEQGMATQMPSIEKYRRFRPFVEDELDNIAKGSHQYIAHPKASSAPVEHKICDSVTLAVGPEGGFIENELKHFIDSGFIPVHLGARILKVETAVPVLLAKCYETV